MKSSHIIMQRAFSGRNKLMTISRSRKNGTKMDIIRKLRKHVKPFVVVAEQSQNGQSAVKHVLSGQVSKDKAHVAPVQNGHPSSGDDEDTIEKFVTQYDEVLIVTSGFQKDNSAASPSGNKNRLDEIHTLLRKTLDRRAAKIACRLFDGSMKKVLLIGISLDQTCAYDNVVKGPPANDARLSAEFRKLWGKWSECRRFPDLSTCEAVYFPAKLMAEKRNITHSIVEHVLKEHFQISSKSVVSLSPLVNQFLKPPETPAATYGTGEEVLYDISHSLEDLIKRFRQLTNLPLSISAIQGISAAFRGADVWPRPAHVNHHPEASPTHVHEVVMSLEASGKWPDDLNALRAVKYQFIAELCSKITADLSINCKPAPEHLDVFHEGHVFHIIPSVKKEVTLLRQVKSPTGVLTVAIDSCEEADRLHTQNDILPKLTGALNGISTRFMPYNTTCRLVKRWISSQFMDGYLDELITELLVAHTFIASDSAPSTPLAGFRRFLTLVSTFPFAKQPLVVDLNSSLSDKDIANIRSFHSKLEHKPPLFIVTPYDRKFGMFSKVRNSVNSAGVVKLLIECASKSQRILIGLLSDPNSQSLKPLFDHAIEKPHVVIHLKKKLPAVSPAFNSNPIRDYLNNLRRCFDDFAVFLFDFYGGSEIIVYWKSIVSQNQSFVTVALKDRVLLEPHVSHDEKSLTVNVEGLLESFSCLGQEIIHKIETKAENWPV
jgi:U3 small nucleolar RNA-associated protein 22